MGCSPHGSDLSRKNAKMLVVVVVGCWLLVVGCWLLVVVVSVASVILFSKLKVIFQKSKACVANLAFDGVVFNGPLTRLFRSGSKAQYEKHHFVMVSIYSEMG